MQRQTLYTALNMAIGSAQSPSLLSLAIHPNCQHKVNPSAIIRIAHQENKRLLPGEYLSDPISASCVKDAENLVGQRTILHSMYRNRNGNEVPDIRGVLKVNDGSFFYAESPQKALHTSEYFSRMSDGHSFYDETSLRLRSTSRESTERAIPWLFSFDARIHQWLPAFALSRTWNRAGLTEGLFPKADSIVGRRYGVISYAIGYSSLLSLLTSTIISSVGFGAGVGRTLSPYSVDGAIKTLNQNPYTPTASDLTTLYSEIVRGAGQMYSIIYRADTRVSKGTMEIGRILGVNLTKQIFIELMKDWVEERKNHPQLKLNSVGTPEEINEMINLAVDACAIFLDKWYFSTKITTASSNIVAITTDHFYLLNNGKMNSLEAFVKLSITPLGDGAQRVSESPSAAKYYKQYTYNLVNLMMAALYLHDNFTIESLTAEDVTHFLTTERFAVLRNYAIAWFTSTAHQIERTVLPLLTLQIDNWSHFHKKFKETLDNIHDEVSQRYCTPNKLRVIVSETEVSQISNASSHNSAGEYVVSQGYPRNFGSYAISEVLTSFFALEARSWVPARTGINPSPICRRTLDTERGTQLHHTLANSTKKVMSVWSGCLMVKDQATVVGSNYSSDSSASYGGNGINDWIRVHPDNLPENVRDIQRELQSIYLPIRNHVIVARGYNSRITFLDTKLMLVLFMEDADKMLPAMVTGTHLNPKYFRILYDPQLDNLIEQSEILSRSVEAILESTAIPVIRFPQMPEYLETCLTQEVSVNERIP